MLKSRVFKLTHCASALALTTALAGPVAAHAQAGGGGTQVETIVVTANKRAENLQNAVGTIQAFSAAKMATQGIHSVDDLTQHVAGMTFYTVSGTAFITLRGVGVPVDTGASDPNTAVNVDGVNLPRTSEMTVTSFDMDQVEVASGPQGTLYGRNSVGGAVNFITKKPTNTPSGEFSIGAGNYARYDAHGYVSGPLNSSDTLRGLVSGEMTTQGKGFVKDLYNGTTIDKDDTWGFRAALSADLSPTLRLDISAMTQHERYDQYQQLMGDELDGCLGGVAVCGAGLTTIPNLQYTLKPWEIYQAYSRPSYKDTQLYSAMLKWDITPTVHLRSISGATIQANTKGLDGEGVVPTGEVLPAPSDDTVFQYKEPSHYYSQEFNLYGEFGDKGSWVFGLFASDEDYRIDIPIYLPGAASQFGAWDNPDPSNPEAGTTEGINYRGLFHEDTQAVFGDVTVPITHKFRLIGGIRVAHEENDTHQDVAFGLFPNSPLDPATEVILANGCSVLTGGALGDATYDLKWNPVTPRAGFQYDFTDKIRGYFTWSKGFKDGGTSPTGCGNTFKPEYLTSYEAGIKSTLFDNRLMLNISGYHYDYKGMQVYEGIGAAASEIVNGDATINGVDVDMQARLTHQLSVDVHGTYLDDYFTNFLSDDASDPLNTRGLPTTTVGGVPIINLKGYRIPGDPDYNINAGVEWRQPVPLGIFDTALFRIEGEFIGRTDILVWARPEDIQKPFVKLNAVIQLMGHDGWTLRFYGRNLTNEATTYHFLYNGGVNTWNGQYAPPMTFGLELTKHFGA